MRFPVRRIMEFTQPASRVMSPKRNMMTPSKVQINDEQVSMRHIYQQCFLLIVSLICHPHKTLQFPDNTFCIMCNSPDFFFFLEIVCESGSCVLICLTWILDAEVRGNVPHCAAVESKIFWLSEGELQPTVYHQLADTRRERRKLQRQGRTGIRRMNS